jgi:hypothetical protein
VIPVTGAGDIQEVTFLIINFLQIGVVAYSFDALLKGNDLIVARHECDLQQAVSMLASLMPGAVVHAQ